MRYILLIYSLGHRGADPGSHGGLGRGAADHGDVETTGAPPEEKPRTDHLRRFKRSSIEGQRAAKW